MESQPQNPEFRINPENFHPCCILSKSTNRQDSRQQNCDRREKAKICFCHTFSETGSSNNRSSQIIGITKSHHL